MYVCVCGVGEVSVYVYACECVYRSMCTTNRESHKARLCTLVPHKELNLIRQNYVCVYTCVCVYTYTS